MLLDNLSSVGTEALARWGWSLSGLQVVLQSSLLDGVAFDPFSLQEDGPVSAEVDVDEARDLGFEIARQVIVLEQNAVLERMVPAFDLALGLRMARRATNMHHAAVL